jgi:homoserine kinase
MRKSPINESRIVNREPSIDNRQSSIEQTSIDTLQSQIANSFSVRVPSSSSNLGAGFDCFSLALKLHLTVTATVDAGASEPCVVVSSGEGSAQLPSAEDNLIFRAMQFIATQEDWQLPPVRISVVNEIPIGRGLGSSAAAIVAGLTLASLICGQKLSANELLRYAFEIEGHADNAAAGVYGGLVVSTVKADGDVVVVKRPWPNDLKVIVVSPDVQLKTADARHVLPEMVKRTDAVFNLQRVALFGAALESGQYDLLWEAMQDRLHQKQRQGMVPGLAEALAIPRQPGLLGVALSGSGPSVVAIAQDHAPAIWEALEAKFRSHDLKAAVRVLEVDEEGCKVI